MGRSRSPRRKQWTEWISRTIAGFGRHPNKRPKGLHVDKEGNMLLEQVMNLWGYQNECQDQDVLEAIKDHMFHEDGNLRFSIDHGTDGRMKIRVLPKRDKWSSHGGAAPNKWPSHHNGAAAAWKNAAQRSNSWNSWNGKQPPTKQAPAMRGSVLGAHKIMQPQAKSMSTAKKLDMPLESLIETERAEASMLTEESEQAAFLKSAFEQATNLKNDKAANVRRGMEQMGLTPGSAHFRQKAKVNWNGRRAWGQQGWGQQSTEPHRSDSPMRSRRDGSRSPSPGDEDDALADYAKRSLNVSSNDRPVASNGITLGQSQKKPDPPPGEHWTKYEDEGNIWFYYEGPLGKWWCSQNEKESVQPYEDDED